MEQRLFTELEMIMKEMPEKCQTAFRLKWFEEKKIREIAEIMNISTTMVDKHLAKGLEIARKKLNPDLYIFLLARFQEG
jgi:RNA polymerase sigma-70 factor (ECF subfamily)